jgi:hypothetical protein
MSRLFPSKRKSCFIYNKVVIVATFFDYTKKVAESPAVRDAAHLYF